MIPTYSLRCDRDEYQRFSNGMFVDLFARSKAVALLLFCTLSIDHGHTSKYYSRVNMIAIYSDYYSSYLSEILSPGEKKNM